MTPQELANKVDYEGGIVEVIYWGGPEVFNCLGEKAVELATIIMNAEAELHTMLPEPNEDYEYDDYDETSYYGGMGQV